MKKFLFFLILLGAGAGGYYYWHEQQKQIKPAEPKRERVDKGDVVEKVSAQGKVAPIGVVIVSSDVPLGVIVAINEKAEINKRVTKNDWLIRLDDAMAKARLQEADSAMSAAKANVLLAMAKKESAIIGVTFARDKAIASEKELERQKSLLGDNIAPGKLDAFEAMIKAAREGVRLAESEVAVADAAIKAAEAMVLKAQAGIDLANKGVEMMTIRAPETATILDKSEKVLVGGLVAPQNGPLFMLYPDTATWEIRALVGEGDIAKVKEGMTGSFTVDAYSSDHMVYKAKVKRIGNMPMQLQKSGELAAMGITGPTYYPVIIDVIMTESSLRNDQHPLKSGMSANVDLVYKEVKNALRMPNAAFDYRPDKVPPEHNEEIDHRLLDGWKPIWVWHGGQQHLCFVKTGPTDGSRTVIEKFESMTEGLKLDVGTEVVIEGPPPQEKGLFSGKVISLP